LRQKRVAADTELLSVAGAVGSPVLDGSGRRVGSIDDLLVHWEPPEPHPPLVGALVRARHGRTFVPVHEFAALRPDRLELIGSLEARTVERQPWLVGLAHDVLDRQIVDVDGTDVARVSDLVLGRCRDEIRLVGADVSARTLVRRLGPASLRRAVARERLYDWATVGAFPERGAGDAASVLRLTEPAARLPKNAA
jgi:sporulation protein YlmC with PRC-barrel domain